MFSLISHSFSRFCSSIFNEFLYLRAHSVAASSLNPANLGGTLPFFLPHSLHLCLICYLLTIFPELSHSYYLSLSIIDFYCPPWVCITIQSSTILSHKYWCFIILNFLLIYRSSSFCCTLSLIINLSFSLPAAYSPAILHSFHVEIDSSPLII